MFWAKFKLLNSQTKKRIFFKDMIKNLLPFLSCINITQSHMSTIFSPGFKQLRLLTLSPAEFTSVHKLIKQNVANAVMTHLVSGGVVSELPAIVCRSTEPRCKPSREEKILQLVPDEWVWSEWDERNDAFHSRERFEDGWPLLNVIELKSKRSVWITGVQFLAQVAPLRNLTYDVQKGTYEEMPAHERYQGKITLTVDNVEHPVVEDNVR